jgi:tetratricopeptide (TPR) repeat protein
VNFDDDVNFLNNPWYRGFALEHLRWMLTTHAGHYIPLTWMSLGLDYALWGMNPLGYHLTSLLLHAANAALCVALLDRILGRALPERDPRSRGALALAGALFFSVHPLRVESVAWITERRDVLSGFFFLLSLLAYLSSTDEGPGRRRRRALSLAAFAASVLSKAMGMTLPLALLVLDAWPLRRFERERPRAVLLEKLPFFLVMAAAVGLTAWAQTAGGAVSGATAYPPVQSLLQPGYRLSFYVLKTLIPLGLSPLYLYRPGLGVPHAAGWAAVIFVTVFLWRRRRQVPGAAAAWALYLLLIAPVSGVVQAGPHAVADRYTYLAGLPFAGLFAALPALPSSPGLRRGAGMVAGLALAVLAGLTVRQCGYWRDSLALWDRALSVEPDVYFSLHNRGTARMEVQDWPGARADFDRAIALNPAYPNTWYDRGTLRGTLGDHAGAVEDYSVALRLAPDRAEIRSARGLSRSSLGDQAGAIDDLTGAIERDPSSPAAHLARGLARARLGRWAEALQDFDRAAELRPEDPQAQARRGTALIQLGDRAGAARALQRALDLAPRDWPDRPWAEQLLFRALGR